MPLQKKLFYSEEEKMKEGTKYQKSLLSRNNISLQYYSFCSVCSIELSKEER
jgi:hypothetical protein